MKKTLTIVALIGAIGLLSHSAYARWGNGPDNGFGPGAGFGPGSCGSCDQNSTVDEEARQNFFTETGELRNELRTKRSEYFALMNSDSPDKDTAQVLWGEIFDLQQQIQEKATEAGLSPQAGGPGGKFGRGPGRGCGSFNQGSNGSNCSGQGCPQTDTIPTE